MKKKKVKMRHVSPCDLTPGWTTTEHWGLQTGQDRRAYHRQPGCRACTDAENRIFENMQPT